MLGYIVGGSFATLFGSNVINRVVTNTINLAYSGVSFIVGGSETSKNINEIYLKLRLLDIDVKIDMVKVICSKIKHDDISNVCETSVEELIKRIEFLRGFINKELYEYKQKWLHSYRVVNLDNEINELVNLVSILDGRISLLMYFVK